ncbi:MAG: glycoside hydrolase family 3 C-terminal domain-containing protein, partial [Actinomycetota bacterium]
APVTTSTADPSPFAAAAERVAAGGDHHAEATALVDAMTLQEKLGCLDGDVPFWPALGAMTAGAYYQHPWPAAVVERLGVPGLLFADGPRGAVIADGVAFPVSMARGATFDPALEERVGDAIGLELRAAGATFTGAVCMNLLRHPAWGRAQETYGEDPHHVGEMAAAFTRGLQRHVMACMKHFALNSMENARFSVDVTVDERALHEVYLPHFRRVAEEGVASTMSAYNSVNGQWCGESDALLTDVLRDEWGWDGFVISDFVFGLRDPVRSVVAGLDIDMPFRQQRAAALGAAIESGELDVDAVDASVRRTVATLLRFADVGVRRPALDVVGCAPHRALAREVAAATTVLLRNEGGLLPVKVGDGTRIAVLGGLAAVPNLGDGGSSDVKATTTVTPLDGLRAAYGDGAVWHRTDLDDTDGEDEAAMRGADLVVVVVGYTKEDEGEYLDDAGTAPLVAELFPPMDHPELGIGAPPIEIEPSPAAAPPTVREDGRPDGMATGGDRRSLRLRAHDEALIEAARALSDRVVVVVQAGSSVVMPWADGVPAVVMGWYAGVEGGNGLADVLSGRAEPGGRLPFVIPTDEQHLPPFDPDATSVTYDGLHGQWLLDEHGVDPHFPFGSGMGWGVATVADASWTDSGLTVRIEHTSGDATSTVVFVHASVPQSSVARPSRRLVGFARVEVEPGGRSTVTIPIDWRQLDIRRDGSWWTEPGVYRLWVGGHAGDPDAVVVDVDR